MRPATNPIARAVQEIDRQIARLQAARVTLGELIADQFNAPRRRGRPRKQVSTIVIDGGLPRAVAAKKRRRARKV